jgi:hypothetical protein
MLLVPLIQILHYLPIISFCPLVLFKIFLDS